MKLDYPSFQIALAVILSFSLLILPINEIKNPSFALNATIDIDMDKASEKFAKGLTFKTVTYDDPSTIDYTQFTDM